MNISLIIATTFNIIGETSGDAETLRLAIVASPVIVFALVYYLIYKYYRNRDKRHKYEHTTKADYSITNSVDTLERSFSRSTSSRVSGENTKTPYRRL